METASEFAPLPGYIRCNVCSDPHSCYQPEYPHTEHVTCDTCGHVSLYPHAHCSRCNGWRNSPSAPGETLCYTCTEADRKARREAEIANGIRAKVVAAARKAGIADADSIVIVDHGEQSAYGNYDGFRVTAESPATAERAARWIIAYEQAKNRREAAKRKAASLAHLRSYGCYMWQQESFLASAEVTGLRYGNDASGNWTLQDPGTPTGAWIARMYYYSIGD